MSQPHIGRNGSILHIPSCTPQASGSAGPPRHESCPVAARSALLALAVSQGNTCHGYHVGCHVSLARSGQCPSICGQQGHTPARLVTAHNLVGSQAFSARPARGAPPHEPRRVQAEHGVQPVAPHQRVGQHAERPPPGGLLQPERVELRTGGRAARRWGRVPPESAA